MPGITQTENRDRVVLAPSAEAEGGRSVSQLVPARPSRERRTANGRRLRIVYPRVRRARCERRPA